MLLYAILKNPFINEIITEKMEKTKGKKLFWIEEMPSAENYLLLFTLALLMPVF